MKEVSWDEVQKQQGSVEIAQKIMVDVVGKKLKEAQSLLKVAKIPFMIIGKDKVEKPTIMDVVDNRVKLHLKGNVVDRAELG